MRMRSIVAILVVCAAGAVPAHAWEWAGRFTEESSAELAEIHSQIYASGTLATDGVPVKDAVWKSDSFELHMIDGAIFLEPELDGYPYGAMFVGKGTVTFDPDDRRARSDLEHFLGEPAIREAPISFAYFFTLAGSSVLEQIGVEGEPSVPLGTGGPYATCKQAMRQLGTQLPYAFLNRDGIAKGSAWVLFVPDSIREAGHDDAHLLYSFDPLTRAEVSLEVFGHRDAIRDPRARHALDRWPQYKYLFWNVTYLGAEPPVFTPQGRVQQYTTRLTVGKSMGGAEETTKITFTPSPGVSALRLNLTPRLNVKQVTGADGTALPFLQWKFIADEPNFDRYLIVSIGEPLPAGQPYQLEVVSEGPLFDAFLGANVLADEDDWLPRLDDPAPSHFELFCSVPKNMKALGAGELISEEVVGGNREYHFRTKRPHKRSTFYFGDFETHEVKADDTIVELYASSARDEITQSGYGDVVRIFGGESPKYTVNEVANAVRVYNRILGHPLEVGRLRVATTPTGHGRGFEGVILISKYGGTSAELSSADFFRAHEVAHQWWGNMVRPENYPEDRWLSESLAEYMAMEYFQARFEKPAKTRAQIRELWVKPVLKTSTETASTLTGETRKVDMGELTPLIAGGQNVYTKGPLVVGMLRYLFQIQKKNDDAFWELLADFLDKYKYDEASTQDFMNLTEQHLQGGLGWFWDQWFYGTEIPEVNYSVDVHKSEGGDWLLSVNAEQIGTEYVLAIPVYVHTSDGQSLSSPLILRGKEGRMQAKLRQKPKSVSLNDNWEALVDLRN